MVLGEIQIDNQIDNQSHNQHQLIDNILEFCLY